MIAYLLNKRKYRPPLIVYLNNEFSSCNTIIHHNKFYISPLQLTPLDFLRNHTSTSHPIPSKSPDPPPSTISLKTAEVAIDLVNTFESRYADDYESLIGDALRIHSSASASSSSSENELEVSNLCVSILKSKLVVIELFNPL